MQAHFWNAFQESLGGGRKRTQLHGKHVAYRKLGATGWSTIDPTIQRDFSCTSFAANVQFPTMSQGTSTLLFDSAFSMKRHIEEKNGNNAEPGFEVELVVNTQHNVAGHIDPVNPSLIRYTNAWDTADLCLGLEFGRSTRIQHLVEIKSMPSGDGPTVDYDFYMTSATAKIFGGPQLNQRPWDGQPGGTTELNGASAFVARVDSQLRGMMLKPPVAWYFLNGEKISTPVRVSFTITKLQEVKATKHIPRTLISEALAAGSSLFTDATFYPDANPETSTCDGIVKGSSQGTWATLIGGSANYVDDSGADGDLLVQATGTSNQYEQYRHVFFGFDTSSIGSGQTVDSATLRLSFDNQRTSGSMGLASQIYPSFPAANTALATGDYMAFGSIPSTPLTDSARSMESESFDRTNITQTLNADGRAAIDMEGVTNLGIGVTAAHESGSPTWASGHAAKVNILMAETTGTTTDPLLTVTYSAAAADSCPAALMMH